MKRVPGLSVISLGLRLDDGPGCSIVMGAFGSLYLHGSPAAIRALGMAVIAAADERPAAADDAVVPIGTPDPADVSTEPATAILQPTSED